MRMMPKTRKEIERLKAKIARLKQEIDPLKYRLAHAVDMENRAHLAVTSIVTERNEARTWQQEYATALIAIRDTGDGKKDRELAFRVLQK